MPLSEIRLARALAGCMLGTAVGDGVGLPFENLSRRAVQRLAPEPLEHSLLLGKGLVSDDTEHTLMVALSLLDAPDDVDAFGRRLAARLRWWLVSAPPGVGSATARSILKLWIGFSPRHSGVFSAGNGPAMRSALLGVLFTEQPARLAAFVRTSTRLTHRDPKAFEAALAVAVAAGCAARLGAVPPDEALNAWASAYRKATTDATVLAPTLALLREAMTAGWEVEVFAARLGCEKGVSGYALHTVPVALYAWMRHAGDLRDAVTHTVRCGGDTDSTAAIVGAIVGAGLGPDGVPGSWLAGLMEWPRNPAWMQRTAQALAAMACGGTTAQRPGPWPRLQELAWLPWCFARNLAMFAVVIYVYFRRLAMRAIRQ